MSELQVTFDGRNYSFGPGTVVRVGRSSENDIVVNDPPVSRRHAQLTWESSGWVWQNAGQAPTFLGGQPVARFGVGPGVDVYLASPQGPVLRLQATAGQGEAPGPVGTGAPVTNKQNQPGFPGDGQQGYPGGGVA